MARLLYFGSLPDMLGKAAEETAMPASVHNVGALLSWLATRGGRWEQFMKEGVVQVTVNKQFAEMDTPVADTDEIAIISIGLTR